VDPCFCDAVDIGESDYFDDAGYLHTSALFFSYETCGVANAYTAQSCAGNFGGFECTADSKCVYADGACSASTDKLAAARTEEKCTEKLTDAMGPSECRCLSTNLQEHWDVLGSGKVLTNKPGFEFWYDYDYGAMCKAHSEPGQLSCNPENAADADGWCSDPWCYVDPCTCNGPAFSQSDNFIGMPLFYSYEACGSADGYNVAKCPAITDKAACDEEDECVFENGACGVDTGDNRDIGRCQSKQGNGRCSCIGSNLQPKTDAGMVETASLGSYPADYGAQCTAHAEPGVDSCSGAYPADWCMSAWCYVDPCDCDAADIGASDYFTVETTSNGLPLFYSYATCGSEDTYTCVGFGEDKCTADPDCEWTGGECKASSAGLAEAKAAHNDCKPVVKEDTPDAGSEGSLGYVIGLSGIMLATW